MLNIILFGPPGAGKGTQSENLVQEYELVHLSTGDIFRSNIKGGTELGKMAKSFMDKGELVPDDITIGMLQSEVNKVSDANGFIFDGFPRTVAQARSLDEYLESKGEEITAMLALEVTEDELKTRLMDRAQTSGRKDDANMDVIEKRIKVYKEETAPVAAHYESLGKFKAVNGEGDIDEIAERLFSAIETLKSQNKS